MITNLDPASSLYLSEIGQIQQRIADANNQVSSGKKISVASDAPDEIAPLLQLRADQSHNSQIQANLVLAKSNADAADGALSSAIQLMDSALSVATQGTNITMDSTTYQNLAQQVQALQQQMVNLSQTTVQGKYIFSGDQDGSPAYALDLATPVANPDGTMPPPTNGVDQLLTAQTATQQVEDPAGGSFVATQTAQTIFDDGRNADGTFAADNVFNSLQTLRLALLANNPTQIANTITSVKAATDHLNAMESFYGNVQDRIQTATDYASSYDTRLQTEISAAQDADVTSAAMELTQSSTQLQAALQMQAKMPTSTLFDFLG
ncbi:MAG TPA: flagellin [Bryobacteraceae bacterium]|nr:Flagellar hook-associated protein 3 [Candidatus Sulfopaludibacter sp. SbA4]HYW44148.1 flagellin [Bryobacteraceae bacterium]